MFGINTQYTDQTKRVADATDRAGFKNLGHAAAAIRKDAIASIVPADGPSKPGDPPHTHTQKLTKKGKVRQGNLQRAINFANDKAAEEAVIGPRFSAVELAGQAHEEGEEFHGQDYPERPYMWPALVRNADRFADSFRGSIGE